MKKLFLAVLCAGLFFACGNKKQQTENLVDSTACQQEMVEETPAVEEQEPVAEVQEPAPAPAPAKKTTTTAKKTTTNNNGMTAGKTNEAPTVEQHAKDAANRVANKAIDKAETESTNAIVNSGKKKR